MTDDVKLPLDEEGLRACRDVLSMGGTLYRGTCEDLEKQARLALSLKAERDKLQQLLAASLIEHYNRGVWHTKACPGCERLAEPGNPLCLLHEIERVCGLPSGGPDFAAPIWKDVRPILARLLGNRADMIEDNP